MILCRSDGTIYIGSARSNDPNFDAGLYAITSEGKLKWIYKEPTGVTTPPAIGPDGTIYIGAGIISIDKSKEDAGKVVAVTPQGKLKWRFDVKLWMEGAATIGTDGNIYFGTKEGDVYALTSEEKEIWKFSTGNGVSATPAIGKDGTIYVGSWDTYFYALSPDGKQKWRYKTPEAFEGIACSAAIGSDGTIYVGANSGYFYAFNPNSTLKWKLGSFGSIGAGPAIGSDGTVYFGAWDNNLYAIGSIDDYSSYKPYAEDKTDELVTGEWNPKETGVDCFEPKSKEIEEKCDMFCNNHPNYCPGYVEREAIGKEHHEKFNDEIEVMKPEKQSSAPIKLEDSAVPKEDIGFLNKFFNWLRNLFR
ncbi:MAG: PQQ-binding-like beta-propeller repeat protein [Candidatus Woesearchaeota archaeon]